MMIMVYELGSMERLGPWYGSQIFMNSLGSWVMSMDTYGRTEQARWIGHHDYSWPVTSILVKVFLRWRDTKTIATFIKENM